MFTYNRLNNQKEEQCRREGINHSHAPQFREMGDESPLFRLESSVNNRVQITDDLLQLYYLIPAAASLVNRAFNAILRVK